ncbi:hypothetical protein [Chenggangzhangella methanolivorans]|uniref:hypothetical protein n=1 Tax=Chenggangzhangella methanolivorans TaxID=1437009 RepID=UPI0021BD838E|nr:hypothetical protein [Chenggangzhangella methanolivorans]
MRRRKLAQRDEAVEFAAQQQNVGGVVRRASKPRDRTLTSLAAMTSAASAEAPSPTQTVRRPRPRSNETFPRASSPPNASSIPTASATERAAAVDRLETCTKRIFGFWRVSAAITARASGSPRRPNVTSASGAPSRKRMAGHVSGPLCASAREASFGGSVTPFRCR